MDDKFTKGWIDDKYQEWCMNNPTLVSKDDVCFSSEQEIADFQIDLITLIQFLRVCSDFPAPLLPMEASNMFIRGVSPPWAW